MADGKNIEIKIAATGGDQAAAEVRKVEEAAKSVTEATLETGKSSGLSGTLDLLPAKAEAATKALAKTEDATVRVTRSTLSMGTGMQNVGYQIQDLAVQIGSGTSAFRALGQQLPQLLSGFGPLGITLGVVSAVALPLAGAMFNLGEGSKKAADEIDELKDVTDDYAEAAKKAVQARDVEALRKWLDALDDEEEKQKRLNISLEKSIELQIKLRTLTAGVDAAKRDLAVANIESDPNLSEADKIRQIGEFRNKDAREKAREKIARLSDESKAASGNYDTAQAASDRQAADAAEATRKREEIEAAQAAAAERARIASQEIPKLKKDLENAEASLNFSFNPETGGAGPMTEQFEKEIAALKVQLAKAKEASGGDMTAEQRKDEQEKNAKLLAEARAGEERQKAEAEKARAAAEDAYNEKLRKEAAVRLQEPLIIEQVKTTEAASNVRTETAARKAEEAAKQKAQAAAEKKKREDERAEKDRLEDQRDDAKENLKGSAAANGAKVAGSAGRANNKAAADALKDLGKDIGNADTDAEIKAAKERIAASQELLGNSIVSALQKMVAGQEALVKKVQVLEGQIKNRGGR